jgi:hypothetical protein
MERGGDRPVHLAPNFPAELECQALHSGPRNCLPGPCRYGRKAAVARSYVLGFVVFVVPTSNLEHWALAHPVVMAALFVIVLLAWYGVSRIHHADMQIDQELIFEEKAPLAFELLDLARGSRQSVPANVIGLLLDQQSPG